MTVQIAANEWSANSVTKTISGVTSTSVNMFSLETISNMQAWANAGIVATAQSQNSITFTCVTTPTTTISFKVIII